MQLDVFTLFAPKVNFVFNSVVDYECCALAFFASDKLPVFYIFEFNHYFDLSNAI